MASKKKIDFSLLAKLYFSFFKIGAFTFGGGLAMLPMLERELCDRHKWTNREQLYDYYAISQITPGIIAVNVATFIGFNLAGILGGVIATFGVVTPSVIIITVIAYFLDELSEIYLVQKALAGINVAVACLLVGTVVKFAKIGAKSCNVFLAVFLMVLSFVLIEILNVPTYLCIVCASAMGVLFSVLKNHKKSGAGKKTAKKNDERLEEEK